MGQFQITQIFPEIIYGKKIFIDPVWEGLIVESKKKLCFPTMSAIFMKNSEENNG